MSDWSKRLLRHIAWNGLAVAMFANMSAQQLLLTVSPDGPQVVQSGETICLDLEYRWASTTANLTGVELVVGIPPEFGGNDAADFMPTTTTHIETVVFDDVNRELIFTYIETLPAGSSGVIEVCIGFPNGSTLNNTMATIDIEFSGDGQPGVNPTIDFTAQAAPMVTIEKSTINNIQPAQGETTPYRIVVNNNKGLGNYDHLIT